MPELEVDALAPYHKNARRGKIDTIVESLQTLGQYRPIVVNRGTKTGRTNEILAGNHTWRAAKQLGWKMIDVHLVDVDDSAARKINLVDNRANDIAGYDEDVLVALLKEAAADADGLLATGYDTDDLEKMLTKGLSESGDADEDNMEYTYGVVIECGDEDEQKAILDEQIALGRTVRALI